MKDNIRKLYNDWLEDTINAEVPYRLDPAVGEVTEDLNLYTGLDLTWEEWSEYYEDSLDYIEYLEERADARKRFEGRRFGDLTEKEKEELMSKVSGTYEVEHGGEVYTLDFNNGLSISASAGDGEDEVTHKVADNARFYFADEV